MSNLYNASTTIDDVNKDFCLMGNVRLCNVPPSTVLAFIITLIGLIFAIIGIILLSGPFGIASYSLLTGLIAFWIPSPAFNTGKTLTQLVPTTESAVQNAVERAAARQNVYLSTNYTVGSSPLPSGVSNDMNANKYKENITVPTLAQPSMSYTYRSPV